jgi:hypothetical protein
MKRILVFALLLLSCCASLGDSNGGREWFLRARSVCEILASAQKYDGQNVLISGRYLSFPHGAVLFGAPCPKEKVGLRYASHYEENSQARQTINALLQKDDSKPIDVVYRGTFHVVQGLSCSVVRCFRYEIEISNLLAARPVGSVIDH